MYTWINIIDDYIIYWLVVEPPLCNIWVRQLGLLFPIWWENKTCLKPPISIYIYRYLAKLQYFTNLNLAATRLPTQPLPQPELLGHLGMISLMFPLLSIIPVMSQWGRYNLPRYTYTCILIHDIFFQWDKSLNSLDIYQDMFHINNYIRIPVYNRYMISLCIYVPTECLTFVHIIHMNDISKYPFTYTIVLYSLI